MGRWNSISWVFVLRSTKFRCSLD